MSEKPVKPLVVTDLDGTLLDHHTYSHTPAKALLKALRDARIPVIANTSKTRAEWLPLAAELGNQDPFVVENGSAIFLPDGETGVFGIPRETILEILAPMRGRYRFKSYADWNTADIMARTGLDRESAELSARRDFSEPLEWHGSEEENAAFRLELENHGLTTLRGGRFLHVLGRTDKGKAVDFLRARAAPGTTVIALGDGPNDIAMLRAADIGIVIKSPTGHGLDFTSEHRVIRSTLEGPEGWVETLKPLLDSHLKSTSLT